MWQFLDHADSSTIDKIWAEFKDVPVIFDDTTEGDYAAFKKLAEQAKWYSMNQSYIMLSDFAHQMAVWHTLVKQGDLAYVDAWQIMLDVFDRFKVRLIVSGVPDFNKRALRAAKKAGFYITKVTPEYTVKNGQRHAMHFMAINREIVCQRLFQSQSQR